MIHVNEQSSRKYYGEQGPNQCRATVMLPEQPKAITQPMNCTLALGHTGAHQHDSCYMTITWKIGSGTDSAQRSERLSGQERSAEDVDATSRTQTGSFDRSVDSDPRAAVTTETAKEEDEK